MDINLDEHGQPRSGRSLHARNRRGATAVEYGLIVSLITLVVLSAAFKLYENVQIMWDAIAAAMP